MQVRGRGSAGRGTKIRRDTGAAEMLRRHEARRRSRGKADTDTGHKHVAPNKRRETAQVFKQREYVGRGESANGDEAIRPRTASFDAEMNGTRRRCSESMCFHHFGFSLRC